MRFWHGLAVALLALAPSAAKAQAFGIEMGTAVSDLDVVEDIGDFYYTVNPPRPVSGFETCVVYAAPESGVCVVRGIGKNFERDGYGIKVRDRFRDLKNILDKNYGNGALQDGLRPGALWDEVDVRVMALRQNERYYQAEWQVDAPEGIDDIIMSVKALSSDTSFLSLQYRFSNVGACRREAREQDAGGL
ncbi:MAG: hypothetical protein GDA53_08715 [Rhodobacteraceae bacterium]|nr:hypothetical protein [Paracoccaceae bacterium]